MTNIIEVQTILKKSNFSNEGLEVKSAREACLSRNDYKKLKWRLNGLANRHEAILEEAREGLEHVYRVKEFFDGQSNENMTIRQLHKRFNTNAGQNSLSFRKFYQIVRLVEYKYLVSKRTFRANSNHFRVAFFAFETIARTFSTDQNSLLFFDSTTFCFEVNPRRAWQHRENPTVFTSSTNYKRFHLLMLISTTRVFAYQVILGKVLPNSIALFLFKTLNRFQTDYPGVEPSLVLDNAKTHKTLLIKRCAVACKTRFVFTAPHSPYLNSIEECFRFLKCKYRNRHNIEELPNKMVDSHRSSEQNSKN